MSQYPVDDTQLAAYLEGEADDLTTRRIEAALERDPVLGERLDRIHDTLIVLRDPDAVEPPAGLSQRLHERLQQETAAPARTAHPVPAPSRRRWYPAVGLVAAALVGLAVIGGGFIGTFSDTMDMAEESAVTDADDDLRTMEDAAAPAPRADVPGRALTPEDGEQAPLDMPEAMDDADDAASDVADLPAISLPPQPIPVDEASARAASFWDAAGDVAAQCRGEVEQAARAPAVPFDFRSLRDNGRPVLVYDLATYSGTGEVLDTATRITVDEATCRVVGVVVRSS